MSRQATRHFRGDRIRELRGTESQEALAIRIGVRVRTVQRWEDPDGSEPSGGDLIRLARALDCAPESFYDESEPTGAAA
jgi:transcriptional regulator with XRE-family HTH domain